MRLQFARTTVRIGRTKSNLSLEGNGGLFHTTEDLQVTSSKFVDSNVSHKVVQHEETGGDLDVLA